MSERICVIDSCITRAQPSHGMCVKHYKAKWYQANRERVLAEQAARKASQSAEERERRLQGHRDYYQRNRERQLAREAERYRNDAELRERKCAVARAWLKANPARAKARKVAYYRANKATILAKTAAYYETHREELQAAMRIWRENNPEQANLLARNSKGRRRARELGGRVTKTDLARILAEHGMVCHICDSEIADVSDLHFDHVIPLAKGGAHCPENVRPAHARCNRRKAARLST